LCCNGEKYEEEEEEEGNDTDIFSSRLLRSRSSKFTVADREQNSYLDSSSAFKDR
jgi:hypothetical protein